MLYFIRHGQSAANEKGLFAGQREDSPLTRKGEEQARIAGEELLEREIHIDKIVSSPLRRALDTAKIIAKVIGMSEEEIEQDVRLAEYDMGALTGQIRKEGITSKEMISAEGAEDPRAFMLRVLEVFGQLSQEEDESILVCTHAGVGRILEAYQNDIAPEEFYSIPAYPNAQILKMESIE